MSGRGPCARAEEGDAIGEEADSDVAAGGGGARVNSAGEREALDGRQVREGNETHFLARPGCLVALAPDALLPPPLDELPLDDPPPLLLPPVACAASVDTVVVTTPPDNVCVTVTTFALVAPSLPLAVVGELSLE